MSEKKKWEIELEKYLKNKIKNVLGFDDDEDIDINVLKIEDLFDYENISDDNTTIEDLSTYYAFTMMTEEFEKSLIIKEELEKRDCKLDLVVNDETATLNVYQKVNNEIPYVDVKFKVVPEGLIIDFEHEDF